MAAKVIKELHGFSGNEIYLMKKPDRLFVRKSGDVFRNFNQLTQLFGKYPVPEVYGIKNKTMDMEYIHGLDMRNYLLTHPANHLNDFLHKIFYQMSSNVVMKDYTSAYIDLFDKINFSVLPFTKEDLLNNLPKELPSSDYHGDFTLENLIYTEDKGFIMIDCVSVMFDSWIFDIAKMRQDLECRWFLRNNPAMIENKLSQIQTDLITSWPQAGDDNLLIVMLLRVFRHCKPNTQEYNFLLKEINKLWK